MSWPSGLMNNSPRDTGEIWVSFAPKVSQHGRKSKLPLIALPSPSIWSHCSIPVDSNSIALITKVGQLSYVCGSNWKGLNIYPNENLVPILSAGLRTPRTMRLQTGSINALQRSMKNQFRQESPRDPVAPSGCQHLCKVPRRKQQQQPTTSPPPSRTPVWEVCQPCGIF